MSEETPEIMHTQSSLEEALTGAGLQPGMTILMHSSLGKVGGWICGGAETVILALQNVLTTDGTLMMPAHTTNNSDPAYWQNPPVPQSWWQTIRDEMPAYNPATARTRMMGVLVETFRTFPDVKRSAHPQGSFVAWGKHADTLTSEHALNEMLGEASPIGRLYDLDGHIFLMGVGHGNNTSLHLAEHRARFPGKRNVRNGSAMMQGGKRRWVTLDVLDYDDEDFVQIGSAFRQGHSEQLIEGRIGGAQTLLMPQRPIVDFAVTWMERYRDNVKEGDRR